MRRDADLTPERREADRTTRPLADGRSARQTRRSSKRALLPVGIAVVVAVAAMGVPPTSAFGAALESSGGTAVEEPSDDSLDDPSLEDDPELDGEGTIDGLTGTVNDTLEKETEPLDPILDPIIGDEDSPDDEGDNEPPEEEEEEETETTEPPPDEEAPEEEPAEEDETEEDETEEVPTRTSYALQQLRTFDDAGQAPILDIEPVSFLAGPLIDYVDVPLGPRTTRDVIETLESIGASEDTLAGVLAPFPVAGLARYSNDWGAPRHTPYFHAHEGTDVFASRGTPVIAAFDGVITTVRENTSIGGNSVHLTAPDGTYLYYAHLDGFGPGIREGTLVDAGDVLGYVGDSGNARGTPPHLHIEVHPDGGEAVPPLPYLDQWLADARAKAQELVQGSEGGGPVAASVTPPAFGSSPGVGVFENAANERTPQTATLALVAVLGGLVIAIRQRRRFAGLLASASDTVAPVLGKIRPGLEDRILNHRSSSGAESAPAAPRDVLAPFLTDPGEDHGAEEGG